MRVRKYERNAGVPPIERPATDVKENLEIEQQAPKTIPVVLPVKTAKKSTSPRGPAAVFRKIVGNPNLNIQLMVILLTLSSENFSMDRRIDSMSSTVDKIRNVTDVINNTMKSVKLAAEAPKQIRRLFEVSKN